MAVCPYILEEQICEFTCSTSHESSTQETIFQCFTGVCKATLKQIIQKVIISESALTF